MDCFTYIKSFLKLTIKISLIISIVGCQASESPDNSPSESGIVDQTSDLDNQNQSSTNTMGSNQTVSVDNQPSVSADVEAESEGVYLIGLTEGSIVGQNNNAGGSDVFLTSFSQNGMVLFSRQFGTNESEALGVALKKSNGQGNLHIVGSTNGILAGGVNNNLSDAFLRLYDSSGNTIFTRQVRSDDNDFGLGLDIDEVNGDILIAGETEGSIALSAGGRDLFLRRYSNEGRAVFTRQVGSEGDEQFADLKVSSSGRSYLLGTTDNVVFLENFGSMDIFYRVFADDGRVELTRQFGTENDDEARNIFVDENSGLLVITGETSGNMRLSGHVGGKDIFFSVYDLDGRRLVTRQFGSQVDDELTGAIVYQSTLTMAGTTSGDLWGVSDGGLDFFIRSFNLDGDIIFTRQFGTELDESLTAIAVGSNGTIFLAGQTSGSYVGSSAGGIDAFLHAFDNDGATLFRRQFGSTEDDKVLDLVPLADGGVSVIGSTSGSINGENRGDDDLFIRNYDASGRAIFTRQVGSESTESGARIITK